MFDAKLILARLRRRRLRNPPAVPPSRSATDSPAGWARAGLRAQPRRWLAGGTLLTLVALWILAPTLTFGSAGRQRQATFVASRAESEMLSTMLAEEAGMRGIEATGRRRFLALVRTGQGLIERAGAIARAKVGSDPQLAASINRQLALASRWETLARPELRRLGTRTPGRERNAALTREQTVGSFQAASNHFVDLLLADRSRIQAQGREQAFLIAGILSALVLLAVAGVLRGLGRSDARMRALIDSSPDLITVVDADGHILYQSAAIARILGYPESATRGTPITNLLDPGDAHLMTSGLRDAREQNRIGKPVECRWRYADGSERWLETVCNNLLHDSNVAGIVLNSRDVTERHHMSEQLHKRAFHDALTGLANRAKFEEQLAKQLARGGTPLSVLFIDIDNFKTVNDSLGHSAGDEVLSEIADRLLSCTRVGDTVARMGGDEFGVFLAGRDASMRAQRIADRILRELSAPVHVRSRPIALSASIGIASGASKQSVQEILRDADLALYAAKGAGKDQAQQYKPSLHAAALDRLELESDLRLGLERDELELHYQPLFRLTDGELAGYEALIRWNHPTRGLLSPNVFIEVAEQTGLIVPLTRSALHAACTQAALWQDRAQRALEVAVNLSFVNLKDDVILGHVSDAIHASAIEPHDLVLEITEGNMLLDQHASQQILSDLKGLGVRLALDDFGTGYSSLSRLSQLPFDSLKIPRPFVERITHNDGTFALTQGIVDLGHRLGLSIVAEGIETPTQLARVRAIGCELGQGYLLARPAALADTDPEEDRSRAEIIVPEPPSSAARPAPLTLVG